MAAPEADLPSPDRGPTDDSDRRVLVCSASPPAGTEGCVDVRPGAVATFDGDRVRLPLTVTGSGQRVQVAWADLPQLDGAVASMLESATAVRFGDRSACQRLLGRVNTATIERRLASTARAAGATLVTWTERPRSEVDNRCYAVVVDGAAGSD